MRPSDEGLIVSMPAAAAAAASRLSYATKAVRSSRIDSALALDDALREAATRVAQAHGLLPHWLNDNARPFRPQSLREQDCDVLLEHRGLRVLGAPLAEVFLMKLDASRVRSSNYDDMVALWPYCGFTSAQQVVDRYYDAYPLASIDDFLIDFISDIAQASAGT